MASLTIYDSKGASVGTLDIEPTDLVPRINKQLLHDAVVMYEANQRQGTFGSKSRALVAGSTKKMYRQKGTGNARAGSRRSGIRRGGGHIFHKRPRDFGYRLPRKALQLATRMAVAAKIKDDQITIIDDFKLSAPKTRDMAAIIKAVKCHKASTLLVATATPDVNVYKSARNIEGVAVSPVAELNAWTVLRPRHLLFTKAAIQWIKEQASGKDDDDAGKQAEKPAKAKRATKKAKAAGEAKS
ncbi:MAG TPA: 50S ribosomal protein L4 [Pirellulales bacterium]